MMCGGLGGFFGPGLDFGLRHGPFRGQLGATCSFDAGINRVVCDTVTRGGLSIAQSIAYYDTAGVVQSAYDSLSTNTINVQVSVTGTKVHHGGDTSVVRHASDRTVTGLALRLQTTSAALELGGFVNWVEDFIYTVPSGTTDPGSGFQIYDVTQGNARLEGLEFAGQVHPTRWLHLQGTADYVRGTNTSTGARGRAWKAT